MKYLYTQSSALRNAAIQNADYGTSRTAQLEGQLAQKQGSVVSALQDEGRFATRAAEQQTLADTWRPVPGLPRAPGRYAEAAERVPEALGAATDAGQLVAQRKAERAFLERQLDSLKQSGYSPLSADGIERGIDAVMSKPGMRASTVVQRTLGDVKEKLASLADGNGNVSAADLYTVRKELGNTISVHAKDTANWDKRLTAGLERDLQKAIDSQMRTAGAGKLWDDYLSKFQELSKPINQMDVGAEIADKSINKLTGQMQPQAYARALSDDTAARATGFDKATLLNTMDYPQLNTLGSIEADLARSVQARDLGRGAGSDTVQKLAMTNLMERSGLPVGVLNVPGVGRMGNWAYSVADDEMKQQLAKALLDPKATAKIMQGGAESPQVKALIDALRMSASPAVMGSVPALLDTR